MSDAQLRLHRALADESRVRLLRAVQGATEPVDTQSLADELGLHPTTVRAHLHVLEDAGLVVAEPEARRTPGRPRLRYRAQATESPEEGEEGYRLLSRILASHLAGSSPAPTEEAARAGHAWGEHLGTRSAPFASPSAAEARHEVVALLGRLGFDPEPEPEPGGVALRRCPFLDVAHEHQDVVCAVHLGLMRGALTALRAPSADAELEPFARPSACVARLPVADAG